MKCWSRRRRSATENCAVGRRLEPRGQDLGRLGARVERVGQRSRRRRRMPVPDRVQRAHAVGGAVVAILHRVGLVGLHAARRDHERPVGGHARIAERLDRHESIQADVIGLAREDRGVIFAAAVRADAGGAGKAREVQSVLDAPEIPREILDPARDAGAIRRDRAGPRARSSASATPTTSALELLSPEARGRSLAIAMFAPSPQPGKLRKNRCATTCT